MTSAHIEAPSIWLIGSDNKSLPGKANKSYNSASEQWAVGRREKGLLWQTLVTFTAIWCFPLYLSYLAGTHMHDVGGAVIAGYGFSVMGYLAYRILLDWTGGWVIDKAGGDFVRLGEWYLPDGTLVTDYDMMKSNRFASGIGTQTYVVTNSKKYGFDKHNGIFITKAVFEEAVKKGMKVIPLGKYYEKAFSKTLAPDDHLTTTGVAASAGDPLGLVVRGGWVVFYIQITLGTIAAQIGYRAFKEILPWLMMSTFFSIAFLGFWWTTYTFSSTVRTVEVKTKALLLAVSFSLTGCLILLGRLPKIVS